MFCMYFAVNFSYYLQAYVLLDHIFFYYILPMFKHCSHILQLIQIIICYQNIYSVPTAPYEVFRMY